MRAAHVPRPGVVEVADFDIPALADRQVLVEMRYASVCGSDVHIVFDGFHNPDWLGRPGYPGHEGAGIVVDSRSDAFPVGTAVLTVPSGQRGGCFAEFQAVDDTHLIELPDGADLPRSTQAQQLGTTVFAMKKFLPPDAVPASAVVIGAGSAGLFFLQHLLARGCPTVVVSDLDPGRLGIADRLGATVVQAPGESVVDAIRDLTGGQGADLVIEAAGYDVCRADAVEAARVRGTIGFFGYPEIRGNAPFPVERAFRRSQRMEWVNGTQGEPGLLSFRTALELIRTGAIQVDHCLERAFPLEEVPQALAAARQQGHGFAKIGVTMPRSMS